MENHSGKMRGRGGMLTRLSRVLAEESCQGDEIQEDGAVAQRSLVRYRDGQIPRAGDSG